MLNLHLRPGDETIAEKIQKLLFLSAVDANHGLFVHVAYELRALRHR